MVNFLLTILTAVTIIYYVNKPKLIYCRRRGRKIYGIRSFWMPLSIAPSNVTVEVKRIIADEKVAKHLNELGITAGTRVTVLSSDGGNVILIVKEGRLCLDRTLASRITVAVVQDNLSVAKS